jgi:hypothetical protein
MKAQGYTSILAGIAMLLFAAVGAQAQAEQKHGAQKPMQHGMSKADMSSMMNQPHAALAMAYGQNIGTFAKTLHKQAEGSSPLDVTFARAAVAEIRRSLDQMEEHHGEHMKTMSEAMRAQMAAPNMAAMMKEMDMHRSMLKDAVIALEKDVRADQLDAKQVAGDSANVLKHLDEMAKMHDDKKGKKMK